MKFIFPALLLLVLCFEYPALGQQLAWTFPDSGIVWCQSSGWSYDGGFNGSTEIKIYPNGKDTIINGMLYKVLLQTGYSTNNVGPGPYPNNNSFTNELFGFYRNDTINTMVEFQDEWGSSVFYDFDLNVGDTILAFNMHQPVVDSVAVISISGLQRKLFFFGLSWSHGANYLIEGIGPATGLGTEGISTTTDYWARFDCLTSKDSSYKLDNTNSLIYSENSCDYCRSVETNISNFNSNAHLNIYPNPCSNQLFIESDEVLYPTIVEFRNTLGQLVFSKKPDSNSKEMMINTSNLEHGSYFVTLRSHRSITTRKIVVLR